MDILLITLIIIAYSLIWLLSYRLNKRWQNNRKWTNADVVYTLFASFLFWWVIIPWALIGGDKILDNTVRWLKTPSKH